MPRATSSKSTMSSINGTPRATTPRSIQRDREALNFITRSNAPVRRGVFFGSATAPWGIRLGADRSPKRRLDRADQFIRAKRLAQTCDVGELGRSRGKVERRHSRNGDDPASGFCRLIKKYVTLG